MLSLERRHSVLPGFSLTLGFSLFYLCLVVLIPLAALALKAASFGWEGLWHATTAPRVLASYRLTFGASLAAALVNAAFGLVVAWVLVRYRFPGRRVVDALVDLPFVVRTLQPVLEALDPEVEEAAASLGASRSQAVLRVVLPAIAPAWLTGVALAFARALGEYGSVVFISGNMPMRTEIAPLVIMTKLEQYDYAGATAIAVTLLVASFLLLGAINLLQAWSARRGAVE